MKINPKVKKPTSKKSKKNGHDHSGSSSGKVLIGDIIVGTVEDNTVSAPPPSEKYSLADYHVMNSLAKHLSIGVGQNKWPKHNTGTKFFIAHTMQHHPMLGTNNAFEVWQVYVRRVSTIPNPSLLENYVYWGGKILIK